MSDEHTSDTGRPHGGGSAASDLGSLYDSLLSSAVDKLTRYGTARDRGIEHEPREVTLTDDEAIAVLTAIALSPRDES